MKSEIFKKLFKFIEKPVNLREENNIDNFKRNNFFH